MTTTSGSFEGPFLQDDGWDVADYGGGEYEVTWKTADCTDPYEPNDSCGTGATSIGYGDSYSEPDLCPAGDEDYYRFTGSAGDVIIAKIDADAIGSYLDSYLYLYDSGCAELASNDDYEYSLDSRISVELPSAGTYYLKVREAAHPNYGGPDYYYTISLDVAEPDIDVLPTSLSFEIDTNSGGAGGDQGALGRLDSPVGLSARNPASVYCEDLGYAFGIVEGPDRGQRGQCTFPDKTVCDAWQFLAGTCGQERSICAIEGYIVAVRDDGRDPFSREYAVCVDAQGKVQGSVTEMANLWARVVGRDIGDDGSSDLFFKPPAFADEVKPLAPAPELGVAQPPASFDWRNHSGGNWMTAVKDQGSCGGAWAFTAIGTAEAALNIAAGNPSLDVDLSEQYMIANCSTVGNCYGGQYDGALYYIRDTGIPDEACMPYGDSLCTDDGFQCNASVCTYSTGGECSNFRCSDRCSDWDTRLHHVDRATCMSSDSTKQAIKEALIDHGPLAVRMNINGSFSGDIYQCGSSGTNHAAIIVGYSDSGQYWIVKNSWGSSWNGDGYFKVAYDNCGIQVQPCYVDASPVSGLKMCNAGPGDLFVIDIDVVGSSCWLSVTPGRGTPFTLGTARCTSVDVEADASCVATGQYSDTIRIQSNDPDEDPFDVPVTLTVMPRSVHLPLVLRES